MPTHVPKRSDKMKLVLQIEWTLGENATSIINSYVTSAMVRSQCFLIGHAEIDWCFFVPILRIIGVSVPLTRG